MKKLKLEIKERKLTFSTANHFDHLGHYTFIFLMDLSFIAFLRYWLKRYFILNLISYGSLGSSILN